MAHGTLLHPDWEQHAKRYHQIVAKAWRDENFKKELLANPAQVLKDHGIPLEDPNVQVKAVENDKNTFHLVLPTKPEFLDLLSDENLSTNLGGAVRSGAQFGCVTFSCAC